jgi:uncharacterized SAM-binding protein YcdF (DUF218 family)
MNLPADVDAGAAPARPRRVAWGMFERRARWSLSARGWCAGGLVALGGLLIVFWGIHPFLAVTSRVPADVLVVDGWLPSYTLKEVAEEFRRGEYRRALVVRSLYDSPNKYESGRYAADYIAELLIENGVPREAVSLVFCDVTRRDRTYQTAQATRDWLAGNGGAGRGITVTTLGLHARRSRLLYRRAFGAAVPVGVLSLEDRSYDPEHWWRSSEGLKETISESAAYLYVRLFFRP